MLHPPRDMCMAMNMSDEACMHAVFTYTADLIYRRGGDAMYSVISSQHRIATIQLVKDRVGGPKLRLNDTTMLAVLGLVATVCENRIYHTSAEQEHETMLHVQGLRAMVARGDSGQVTSTGKLHSQITSELSAR
jgi:hypothetical protein